MKEGELKKRIDQAKYEDSEYWGKGKYFIISRDKMISIINEAKKEFPLWEEKIFGFTKADLEPSCYTFNGYDAEKIKAWFLKWFGEK